MTERVPQTTPDQHALAARVIRWALANGWVRIHRGWRNHLQDRDATTSVHVFADAIEVRRKQPGEPWPWAGREYRVDSVRQAVDLLVDLGILPDELHRLYRPSPEAAVCPGDDAIHDHDICRGIARSLAELDAALAVRSELAATVAAIRAERGA